MTKSFINTPLNYDLILLVKDDKVHFIEAPIINDKPCSDIEVRFPATWGSKDVVIALIKIMAEINSEHN